MAFDGDPPSGSSDARARRTRRLALHASWNATSARSCAAFSSAVIGSAIRMAYPISDAPPPGCAATARSIASRAHGQPRPIRRTRAGRARHQLAADRDDPPRAHHCDTPRRFDGCAHAVFRPSQTLMGPRTRSCGNAPSPVATRCGTACFDEVADRELSRAGTSKSGRRWGRCSSSRSKRAVIAQPVPGLELAGIEDQRRRPRRAGHGSGSRPTLRGAARTRGSS